MEATEVSGPVAGALLVAFALTLLLPPTAHLLSDPTSLVEATGTLLSRTTAYADGDVFTANRGVLDAIDGLESAVRNDSPLAHSLRPRVQEVLFGTFEAGNAQVVPAGDRLYFRPSVDHLLGPDFFTRHDPMSAIVRFQEDLLRRGIELVVVVAPTKPTVDGFGSVPPGLDNPGMPAFHRDLARHGIHRVDVLGALGSVPTPAYLDTDTHWTWGAMDAVARRTADVLRDLGLPPARSPRTVRQRIQGHGDLVELLGVPEERIPMEEVQVGRTPRSDAPAQVLVLGDSFSNIYRQEALGFGAFDGFPDRIAAHLGSSVDAIVINDGGAIATRRALLAEPGRLDGVAVVVWEFAARELSFGDWTVLPMAPVDAAVATTGFALPRGTEQTLQAEVLGIAAPTSPGRATYPNEIVALHLSVHTDRGIEEAWAYTWSLRDRTVTPGARLSPGDRFRATFTSFADAPDLAHGSSRSELPERPSSAATLWMGAME